MKIIQISTFFACLILMPSTNAMKRTNDQSANLFEDDYSNFDTFDLNFDFSDWPCTNIQLNDTQSDEQCSFRASDQQDTSASTQREDYTSTTIQASEAMYQESPFDFNDTNSIFSYETMTETSSTNNDFFISSNLQEHITQQGPLNSMDEINNTVTTNTLQIPTQANNQQNQVKPRSRKQQPSNASKKSMASGGLIFHQYSFKDGRHSKKMLTHTTPLYKKVEVINLTNDEIVVPQQAQKNSILSDHSEETEAAEILSELKAIQILSLMSLSKEKIYVCRFPECNRIYRYKGNLRAHEKIHTTEASYKCTFPDCSYSTHIPSDLNKHSLIHTNKRPWKCDHPGCTHTAKTSSALAKHKNVHALTKKYTCPVEGCGYQTKHPDNLKQHAKSHLPDNELPHKCPYCDYRSAYLQTLDYHVSCKHTGLKPFSCPHEECDFVSPDKPNLTKHLKKIHGST